MLKAKCIPSVCIMLHNRSCSHWPARTTPCQLAKKCRSQNCFDGKFFAIHRSNAAWDRAGGAAAGFESRSDNRCHQVSTPPTMPHDFEGAKLYRPQMETFVARIAKVPIVPGNRKERQRQRRRVRKGIPEKARDDGKNLHRNTWGGCQHRVECRGQHCRNARVWHRPQRPPRTLRTHPI